MTLSILKTRPIPVPAWRQIQKENYTSVGKLASFLELSDQNRLLILDDPSFSLNLPKRLAHKIAKNSLHDPILRQFVPLTEETVKRAGFNVDPLQEASFREEKKLVHKYDGRALLIATGACAMHCRYCFRQNFPYETETPGYAAELAYIKNHPDLSEIILSGGDPLSLSDAALENLLYAIDQFPHIKRIRFHTRFPIGIPERIDDAFLEILGRVEKQIFFVIHCNHPRELDEDVIEALKKISSLGIPVLNQSVLLKGVNDDEKTFLQLNEALVNNGIVPYYVHLLDPVQGTAHFHVPDARGQELIRHVQERLSGFGVPRLAREIPGSPSKTFI